MENNDTVKLIIATLDKIRPFIQRDGGDCKYIDFKDGIVYIQMIGACAGCSFIDDTISSGIEIIIMEEVPGVIAVKQASEEMIKEKELDNK
jgi:Fe-S cluster biogenesis protein NfuA